MVLHNNVQSARSWHDAMLETLKKAIYKLSVGFDIVFIKFRKTSRWKCWRKRVQKVSAGGAMSRTRIISSFTTNGLINDYNRDFPKWICDGQTRTSRYNAVMRKGICSFAIRRYAVRGYWPFLVTVVPSWEEYSWSKEVSLETWNETYYCGHGSRTEQFQFLRTFLTVTYS
jgi:hypothetical protein